MQVVFPLRIVYNVENDVMGDFKETLMKALHRPDFRCEASSNVENPRYQPETLRIINSRGMPMNKMRLVLMGLVMVCGLAGCANSKQAAKPQTTEVITTEEGEAGTGEDSDADTVKTGAFFTKGVYEAYKDGELAWYYYFYDEESGRTENASEGTGLGFACEQKEDEIIFHMGSVDDTTVMKMIRDDENHISGSYADGSGSYDFWRIENADPDTFDPAVGMGEDTSGLVDLDGCDTYADIIKKLEKDQGYANVKVDGTDVLLVAPGTFDNVGAEAAISADVYCYDKNRVPQYVGYVSSDGTAYPISMQDQKLYSGGHHRITKSTIMEGKLITLEECVETFDEEGKATYHFSSDDGAGVDEKKDSTTYDRLVDEFMQTKAIVFEKVK